MGTPEVIQNCELIFRKFIDPQIWNTLVTDILGFSDQALDSEDDVEQQNLHKAVACHTLSLPLLFTEVLVLQVLRTNPSEVY